MAEDKKEKVSAETETNKASESKSTEEERELQKNEEQKVAAEKGKEPEEEEVEEHKEKPKKEKKVAADKRIEEKEAKTEEIEEDEAEKSEKADFIGDLNYLPEVRKDLPTIKSGDLVRVSYRVIEGGKERTQVFEGTVIAIKNTGIARTITVRKTSFGIAVERIFPLNSKLVQNIDVTKHSKVRRGKLYYLRNLKGKAARLKELR